MAVRYRRGHAALGQDLIDRVGERAVLGDKGLEMGLSGFGDGEIDAGSVVLGDDL